MEDKVDYFYTPEENREEFEIEAFKEMAQEYTPLKMVDYAFDKEAKVPLSFSQIRNVAQGTAWYEYYHPELLPEICEALARYQFGNIPKKNKRDIPPNMKNQLEDKDKCLIVKRGKFVLTF